jgi:hypothetical protein
MQRFFGSARAAVAGSSNPSEVPALEPSAPASSPSTNAGREPHATAGAKLRAIGWALLFAVLLSTQFLAQPFTLADTDGNPVTAADPTWTPVVPTPNHPEYPAAHGCVFGGMGEALRSFYRKRQLKFSIDTTVAGISPEGMKHSYESIQDLTDDSLAPIWGGMHFRTSVEHGRALGEKAAAWVAAHHFGPR